MTETDIAEIVWQTARLYTVGFGLGLILRLIVKGPEI